MSTMLTYEDVETTYETEETPESIIVTAHVPDGFARVHIGAIVEHEVRRVRVHGERALAKNIRARFNALYQVPEHCDIRNIKGKFDGKTVVITIAKIPEKVPNEETEPESEDGKEATDSDDDQEKTVASKSQEEVDHETTTPPKSTEESMDQKGQEGISQNGTKVESEKEVGEESSTTKQDTEDSKGQEGIPSKDTNFDREKDDDEDTAASNSPQDITSQKAQETIPPKATFTTDAKLQGEEKFEGKTAHENNETENHSKETLESGKPHEGDKGGDIDGKIGNDVGKNSDIKAMPESTRKSRIYQAMTSLTKRFNEEDKQRIHMGAAVLAVVALGVYATYKLRSHRL